MRRLDKYQDTYDANKLSPRRLIVETWELLRARRSKR
jgi:hypothetical protein